MPIPSVKGDPRCAKLIDSVCVLTHTLRIYFRWEKLDAMKIALDALEQNVNGSEENTRTLVGALLAAIAAFKFERIFQIQVRVDAEGAAYLSATHGFFSDGEIAIMKRIVEFHKKHPGLIPKYLDQMREILSAFVQDDPRVSLCKDAAKDYGAYMEATRQLLKGYNKRVVKSDCGHL